jgi:hypothetical protein
VRRGGRVGNGGFSIRSVRAMAEIASRCVLLVADVEPDPRMVERRPFRGPLSDRRGAGRLRRSAL